MLKVVFFIGSAVDRLCGRFRDVIRCLGEMASIVFLTLSIYGLIWWLVGLGEERNRMEGDLYIGLKFSTLCNFTINTLYIIIIKMM